MLKYRKNTCCTRIIYLVIYQPLAQNLPCELRLTGPISLPFHIQIEQVLLNRYKPCLQNRTSHEVVGYTKFIMESATFRSRKYLQSWYLFKALSYSVLKKCIVRVLFTTSKMMQRKLLVVDGCLTEPFNIDISKFGARNLLVVINQRRVLTR